MAPSAEHQIHVLQKTLYDKAYAEARSLAAINSPALLEYSQNYEASLPSQFRPTTLKALIKSMSASDIFLYGDFHTLKQSQRGLIRLVRSYLESKPDKPVVLALETFKGKDQKHVDAFMSGELSEHELLQAVNYATDWGFPWPAYRMILDFAREHGIPVVALNSDNAGRDSLELRDEFAARQIAKAHKTHQNHLIIALMGEYHLADDHLPAAITKRLPDVTIARVLNNVDKYYFNLSQEQQHAPTEYLKLKDDLFCIMNSPPWMKWQSFSMWEEMRSVSTATVEDELDHDEDDADFDMYTEEVFDLDYHIVSLLKNVANFLTISVTGSAAASFTSITNPDDEFFTALQKRHGYHSGELNRIMERSVADGFYVLAEPRTVIVSDMTLNNFAEVAGQYLQIMQSSPNERSKDPVEEFYRRVMKYAAGTIASKILNPRRKGVDLATYKRFLEQNARRRLIGYARMRRDAARAVVEHHEWISRYLKKPDIFTNNPRFPKTFYALDRSLNYEVSRAIGNILGFALHSRVLSNDVPASILRQVFNQKLTDLPAIWRKVLMLYNVAKLKNA